MHYFCAEIKLLLRTRWNEWMWLDCIRGGKKKAVCCTVAPRKLSTLGVENCLKMMHLLLIIAIIMQPFNNSAVVIRVERNGRAHTNTDWGCWENLGLRLNLNFWLPNTCTYLRAFGETGTARNSNSIYLLNRLLPLGLNIPVWYSAFFKIARPSRGCFSFLLIRQRNSKQDNHYILIPKLLNKLIASDCQKPHGSLFPKRHDPWSILVTGVLEPFCRVVPIWLFLGKDLGTGLNKNRNFNNIQCQ